MKKKCVVLFSKGKSSVYESRVNMHW